MASITSYFDTFSGAPLLDDPLTTDQKRKMKGYLDAFLLTDRGHVFETLDDTFGDLETLDPPFVKSYNLPIDRMTPCAQEMNKVGQNRFDKLREAIRNPALVSHELGIDPNDASQVHAARVFLKAGCKLTSYNYARTSAVDGSLGKIDHLYKQKMAYGKNPEYGISPKHQLLIKNDPIQRLPSNPTLLDHVLANTHFEEPKIKQTLTTTNPDGSEKVEVQIMGPSRPETRAAIKEELTSLSQKAITGPIIRALGKVIKNEKGNVIFPCESRAIAPFDNPETSPLRRDLRGFYNLHHTVICRNLINPFDNTISRASRGTFIHETTHFVLGRIVGNRCSPVVSGSSEEQAYEKALFADREHRKTLTVSSLNNNQKIMYKSLVDDLEKSEAYFPGGFDIQNPHHKILMQAEAIVRIPQNLITGASVEDLQVVCPNLYAFYIGTVQPRLEAYCQSNYQENSDSKMSGKI